MASLLPADRYLDLLRADIDRMRSADAARLDAPVAACPGWSVSDLLGHVAGVFCFAEAQLRAEPGSDLVSFDPPGDGPTPTEFETAADALLAAIEATDPDEHRPNWQGAPTAAFYWRRMAQETAIHRADLDIAIDGVAGPIDATLAADGIDELGEVFLSHAARRGISGDGETVHLHATDTDEIQGHGGEWMFRFDADLVTMTHEHGKGDMAVRGSSSDLFLFAWNRRPVEVECFGAPDALAWWAERVTI